MTALLATHHQKVSCGSGGGKGMGLLTYSLQWANLIMVHEEAELQLDTLFAPLPNVTLPYGANMTVICVKSMSDDISKTTVLKA